MVKAIVLVNTEMGSDEEVFKKLKELPQVKAAYMVYGLYDLVVVIEAKEMDELRDIVYRHIRSSPHVRSTLTMIVVNEVEKK